MGVSSRTCLNEYKICQFHQIRSGIIMYGCEAYIFTPISNNDIYSHLKILLRKKTFKHNLTPIQASRQLLLYCREQCKKISFLVYLRFRNTCMKHLHETLGINDDMYTTDKSSYLTLLQRIYVLIFMLRYRMPLQRKAPSGNRNVASSVHCYSKKGWYSYLTRKEQKILNDPSTTLASSFIPDDLAYGFSRSSISDISQIPFSHVQYTSMFRDGSVDSMEFQKKKTIFQTCSYLGKEVSWTGIK